MYSDIVLRTDIDHLVVKRNELVHSHSYLTEGENNLILLAIILTRLYARDESRDIRLDSTIRIYANDYMQIFGVSRNNAYNIMNSAINNLYDRSFSIKENGIQVDHRWLVSKATKEATSVAEGFIEFTFSNKALQLIVDFDHDKGKYTTYGIERVSRLKGRFSGKIYELAMESKYKEVKQTRVFDLEELRKILGVQPEQYRETKGWDKQSPKDMLPTRFDNFRKEVLDKSVSTINLESDIIIKYHTYKRGGRITGLSFSFYVKENYVPKFAQGDSYGAVDAEAIITVGDETKKPPAKKKTKMTDPEPNIKTDRVLGTDLRAGDDEGNGSKFATGFENLKPKEYNIYLPAKHLHERYTSAGGTLSIEELEEKCRQVERPASSFVLGEISRLQKLKNQ